MVGLLQDCRAICVSVDIHNDYAASQDNPVPNHDNFDLSDDAVICVLSYSWFITIDRQAQLPSALPCVARPQDALVVENAPRVQAGRPL